MKKFISALCILVGIQISYAQEHLKDFMAFGEDSNPTKFYSFGNKAYFTATTADYGTELWVSDGTESGTFQLADIAAGNDGISLSNMVEFGNQIVFTVYLTTGTEIWVTDGTVNGTYRYLDSDFNRLIPILVFNDWLFYNYPINKNEFEVRRVNADFTIDSLVAKHTHSEQYSRSNFAQTSNYLFYAFNDQIYQLDKNFSGSKLYYERSTTTVGDIVNLKTHNNFLFWYMRESSLRTQVYYGKEAIGSDAELVKVYGYVDIYKTAGSGADFYFTIGEYNGVKTLYYFNTATETYILINGSNLAGNNVNEMKYYKGQLYFQGYNNGDYELNKTNGTQSGTILVANIASDTSSRPDNFMVLDGKLYFNAYTRNGGRELYVTEGTSATTKKVVDLMPGELSSDFGKNAIVNDGMIFSAAYTDYTGMELWKTDGTQAGTSLIKDINPIIDYGNQQVGRFMEAGGLLYFLAKDSVNGRELWRTDGTTGGIQFLKNINIAFLPTEITDFVEYRNKFFGSAFSFDLGVEMLVSNGTAVGTNYITKGGGLLSSTAPSQYHVLGDYLYFIGSQGLFSENTLFISDGTTTGTAPLNKGVTTNFIAAANLFQSGKNLFFSGKTTTTGYEPYISDGTIGGTKLLSDLNSGSNSSNPSNFTENGISVFFIANVNNRNQLFETDGTTSGTSQAAKLEDLGIKNSIEIDTLVSIGNYIIIKATSTNDGKKRLWSYHTVSKLTELLQPDTSTAFDNPENITVLGNKMLFSANSAKGVELFVSDGTVGGTYLLKDINAGVASSKASHFTVYNDLIYFSATNKANGNEIWVTDGTISGTHILVDAIPGSVGIHLGDMHGYKGYLYFSADLDQRNQSLYRIFIDSCLAIYPQIEKTSDFNSFCKGNGISIKASTQFTTSNYWVVNGVPAFSLDDSIYVNQPGSYYFVAEYNQCIEQSPTLNFSYAPEPKAKASFDTDSVLCEGKTYSLSYKGDPVANTKWYLGGSLFQSTPKISTSLNKPAQLVVKNAFGCVDSSRIFKPSFIPLPKPNVNFENDTLHCTITGKTYQWFYNNSTINGATKTFFVPFNEGWYKVSVTDNQGCAGTSENYTFTKIGVEETEYEFALFPNPTVDFIQIKSNRAVVQWQLLTIHGALITSGLNTGLVDLSSLPKGSYLLETQLNGMESPRIDIVVKQ